MASSIPLLFRKLGAGRRRGLTWRFARNADGAAAVEFGLISIPFFAIIFAVVESALVFWSQQILDTALSDAVRQVYTGQFQQANTANTTAVTLANLKSALCNQNGTRRATIFNCSNVILDVRSPSAFTSSMLPSPLQNGAIDPTFGQYTCPAPGKIALVRAVVEYPILVKLLNPAMANLNDGNRLLIATAAFQTEPYSGQCS